MATAILGLISLPAALVSYRDQGILRRLSTTPVPPSWVLAGQLVINSCIAMTLPASEPPGSSSELDKLNHLADSRRHEAFPNEAMAGPAAQVARTAAPAAPALLLVPLLARRPRSGPVGPAREPPGRRSPSPQDRLAWLAHPAGCGPRVRLPQAPGFPADPVTVTHDESRGICAMGFRSCSGLCGCRNPRWPSGRGS